MVNRAFDFIGQHKDADRYQSSFKLLITVHGAGVTIMSDYRLDNGFRFAAEIKGFSTSLYVQISSEAHPASYPMATGVLSLGAKRGRDVTLTTYLHLVPRS
jgi:hypothetical protein